MKMTENIFDEFLSTYLKSYFAHDEYYVNQINQLDLSAIKDTYYKSLYKHIRPDEAALVQRAKQSELYIKYEVANAIAADAVLNAMDNLVLLVIQEKNDGTTQ